MSGLGAIDTHCHLDQPHFDPDRDEVIDRSVRAGVERMVTLGVDLPSSRAAIALADAHEPVHAAVGFHPHDAAAYRPGDDAVLADLCRHPKVVAIGEIGLDFFRNHAPREVQLSVFRRQLDLAVALDRPVAIHDRNAHAAVLAELQAWAARHPRRPEPAGVLHCFSGDWSLAEACIRLGFMISLAGPLTYPKSHDLVEVAGRAPLEALVIETDAPYLPPQSRRGERNDPTGVLAVAGRIAELRGRSIADITRETSRNARRLFRLPN